MIKIIFLSIILFSGSLVGTINVDVFAQQNNANEKRSLNQATVNKLLDQVQTKGQVSVIVGLDADFTPEGYLAAQEKINQRANIRNAQNGLLGDMVSAAPNNFYKFDYIPFMAMTVNQNALNHLISSSQITSIEENALERIVLDDSRGIVDADPEAYDLGYEGTGYAIVVLDTGVEKTHGFLSGKVVSEACYSNDNNAGGGSVCPGGVGTSTATGSGVSCLITHSSNGGCFHGTHVSGIAAGNKDVAGAPVSSGIAWGAKIISIQVFTSFGGGNCSPPQDPAPCIRAFVTDQVRALERVKFIHDNNLITETIVSVNMSLGGGSNGSTCDGGTNTARAAAMGNLKSLNIATVVASGNSGSSTGIGSPACISSAVSVGATNDSDVTGGSTTATAGFSQSAAILDLLAPGVSIVSSTLSNGYGSASGTSMAAPHVAGAWAIMREKSPESSVDQVLAALKNNGVSVLDPRNSITKPRIDLDDALNDSSLIYCGSAASTYNIIQGTSGHDTRGGTSGADLFFGGAGNDHFQGHEGDDCIYGEDGLDVLSGGAGNDGISGGAGVDNINGWAGADTINGDAGDDIIVGGSGDDTIQGGAGNDHIQGNTGIDILSGNIGDDVISGGTENDIINGNAGNDQITGREGVDTIDGGDGTDRCSGGGQGETLTNCE